MTVRDGYGEASWATGFPEAPARRHAVLVLIALAYLSVWPYFEALNNPNENVRTWMTRAIVEYHTLNIDRVCAQWGYVNDKATGGAHLYSSKAPGASFAGVPILWAETKLWHALGWPSPSKRAATFALRLFVSMVPSIVFLCAFARWVERRSGSAGARDFSLVALGLGSMLYPYGILFTGHAQAAMAGFASFMLLSPSRRGTPSCARIGTAGALAATAVLLEYQLLLIAVVLAVYACVVARQRVVWFVVAALPFAIALGAYHTALFGRPWEFPYGHLENQNYAHIHGVGYHGLAGPRLDSLSTSLFSISDGLFAFSPVLGFGLALGAIAVVRGPRRDGIVVLVAMLLMTLFIAGLSNWRGGWCVGPRYIAGVVPFLVLGLVIGWRHIARDSRRGAVLRAAVGGLLIVSVFANGISAAVYPHYPEVFDNPIFDLTLPLVRDGYVPYGLGWLLGLPRGWSVVPVAGCWATALALAIGGHARTARQALARIVAAAAVAAVVVLPMSRFGRTPSPTEHVSTITVRALWQPMPPTTRR